MASSGRPAQSLSIGWHLKCCQLFQLNGFCDWLFNSGYEATEEIQNTSGKQN